MGELSPYPPGQEPSCPTCGEPMKPIGMCMETLMGGGEQGYDMHGVYHIHDPNWTRQQYQCRNGHEHTRETRKACPASECDYGGVVTWRTYHLIQEEQDG